ncbi:MAG TPA: neuromedin U [Candidatus Krumholzibacteria bacterium]|nr:neuromedin U [Candidatus Krumholzibacteria bacterium]
MKILNPIARVARGLAVPALLVLVATPARSQSSSAQDLSQQAANPIANLMSIPFQLNNDFGLGNYDRTANVLNVQPVIPLMGGKLITRTIFPFVWIPDIGSESGTYSSGLADINFTAFYVPGGGSLTWGVGPIVAMPSGGAERGSEKWSVGPSAVALKQSTLWTLGILANNLWSIAGKSEREDVNKGLIQYFIVRQLGDGWYVNSAPIITVNWKAESGQKWVVPFGAGGGKLFFMGRLPVNVQSQAYYNVVKPDIGPDWQLRFQIQVLLPVPGSK